MSKRILFCSALLVAAWGSLCGPTSAYAGFELIPAAGNLAPIDSETVVISASPSVSKVPESLSPLIISGKPASSPPPLGADRAVQGFATDVPLPLALRQIVPADHSFSIGLEVSPDTLVSYKGGQSWRDTLSAMLRDVGLSWQEQGSLVTVSQTSPAVVKTDPVPVPVPVSISISPSSSPQPSLIIASGPVADPGILDSGDWQAQRGESLRKVLADWCQRAGVELQWLAEYDYPLEASAHFSGGFEEAVRQLLIGFAGAHPQPVAELHKNAAAGQNVLVVQARGNSGTN